MKKNRYLMNCFKFLMDAYSPHMPEYEFKYHFAKEGNFDYIKDYFLMKKMLRRGDLDGYKVIHINNWLNFLNLPSVSKRKDQIWIAHSHGFHIGLNDKKALEDSTILMKIFGWVLGVMVSKSVRNKMKQVDICYAAIPNIERDLKRLNPDAVWIPNPIDTDLFSPKKKTKQQGNPSVFSPTRIHKMKSPEVTFDMFQHIKDFKPDAKLHLIRYPDRYAQYEVFQDLLERYHDDIVWHDFMPRENLPELYSSFDYVLGSFGKGLLSLVELEAMACGATVITHDEYEIVRIPLDKIKEFATRVIVDEGFRKEYTKKCMEYVRERHNPAMIAEMHRENIRNAMLRRGIITD